MSEQDAEYEKARAALAADGKLTPERIKEAMERLLNKETEPYVRVVGPLQYDVIKSMVDDGLISGRPFSEIEAYDEFTKRMNKALDRVR